MANNCLVTKLKGVVDNDNLPIYDGFRLKVGPGNFQFQTSLPAGVVISWDNAAGTVESGQEGVITSPFTIPTAVPSNRFHGTLTKETTFVIKGGFYENKKFGCDSINGGVNLSTTTISKDTFERLIKYGSLKYLGISGSLVTGGASVPLSDIAKDNTLESCFVYTNACDAVITGNVNTFAKCIGLTAIGLHRRGETITGTVENLVSGMCANGRVGGTLQADLRYDNVTFNNLPVEESTSGYLNITFSDTGAIVKNVDNLVVGQYDKGTNTWTYAN